MRERPALKRLYGWKETSRGFPSQRKRPSWREAPGKALHPSQLQEGREVGLLLRDSRQGRRAQLLRAAAPPGTPGQGRSSLGRSSSAGEEASGCAASPTATLPKQRGKLTPPPSSRRPDRSPRALQTFPPLPSIRCTAPFLNRANRGRGGGAGGNGRLACGVIKAGGRQEPGLPAALFLGSLPRRRLGEGGRERGGGGPSSAAAAAASPPFPTWGAGGA